MPDFLLDALAARPEALLPRGTRKADARLS